MQAILLLFLLASSAQAETTLTVGLGKGVMEHEPFERAASIGYRINLSDNWFIKPEIGGWLGGRGKESWFIGCPIGLQVWVPVTGLYATAAVGPSRISQPDEMLGGRGQCDVEFGLGLKTEKANIGAVWKHFSSAGLATPNLGRDFVGIQIGAAL